MFNHWFIILVAPIFQKTFENNKEIEEFIPPVYEKTLDQFLKLKLALKRSFLTKNIPESDIKMVADAMHTKFYKKGEVIIKFGDIGEESFVIESGNIAINIYNEGTDFNDPEIEDKLAYVKYMGAGICFGEIALLYNDKRTSTIKALDDCYIWVLEGQIYRGIVIKTKMQRRNYKLSIIE